MALKPCGVFNYRYSQDMAVIRTGPQWITFVCFLIFMASLPLFATGYILSVLIILFIYIVVVMGLGLLTGYCNQISMAQSAFMAIGAFTTGILVTKVGISHWIAMPCAGIAAGLVGLVFGFPSFKVKGLYLALISIGAQFIIMYTLLHWNALTDGVIGIAIMPARIGPIVFDVPETFYYLAIFMAAAVTYLVKNIVRTRVGRAFIAIRDNDIVAEVMGVNIFAYKLLAFFLGCFFAGIGGWLWSLYIGVASVDHYTLWESIWFLAMVVIGGMGSVLGIILGVVFVEILKEITVLLGPIVGDAIPAVMMTIGTALPLLVMGLVVMIFLIYEPRGLAHRWEIVKRAYRIWPYSR
ncbi:MAG: branched-chain amino acid ABC transporter permease [Proteobacteria bacterium]|nr:branched-chain amino acid ABC transporter permease [Pseudomonadota bacterium]